MDTTVLKELLEPNELALLNSIFTQLESKARSKSEAKQIRKIVPIREWINSDYYAGPDQSRIYPYWKEKIIEMFESEEPINEVILSGSIGCGKSTCALYILLRRFYELSCFSNIPAYFNLMSTSLVSFLYFSLSKTQAELTGFGQFKNLLDSVPYFQENFPRNPGINSLVMWPDENLLFTYGSEPSHAIGMNMFGSILDEANFFSGDAQDPNKSNLGNTSKMSRMYSSIINRAKSRFIVGGKDYSISILISSATTATSFTETRIAEARGLSNVRIYAPAIWEVKPEGTYSDKHFWVFTGDEGVDPYMVDTIADVNMFLEAKGIPHTSYETVDDAIHNLPAHYQGFFIAVPVDFRHSFDVNIIQSLQDIAGVSVSPMGKLFNSHSAYNKCVDETLKHPFTKEQPIISTGDNIYVSDYLIPNFEFRDANKAHFIHIDQSVQTDYTGFSMVHIDHYEEDPYTGTEKPFIIVDLMLDIIPPQPPKQISISKIWKFCLYLRDKMKVAVNKVTYDMYASQEARQELNENDIDADYLSVDRTDEQYLALVNLIIEGRIRFYDYGPFRKELFELIWYRAKRKVDHPGSTATGGTKDLCDSLAGAVWNAINSNKTIVESNENVNLLFDANKSNDKDSDMEDFYNDILRDAIHERR